MKIIFSHARFVLRTNLKCAEKQRKNGDIMKKFKRIAALAVVIAWAALIIITLITAFIDNETAHTLFKGLIFTDIVLPVVAYAMMLMYKYLSGRKQ